MENGGKPLRSRVGHSFIKQMMADHDAVFGGEHSGHFYFKDFWRADSGMLAALHAIAALLEDGGSLSRLLTPFNRYLLSGEINTHVANQKVAIEAIRQYFSKLPETIEFDELDGLTVSAKDWWFNARPSNTEPLLRLNVEASDDAMLENIKSQVLAIVNNQ
jgi:phosphomannomutase